MRSLNRPQKTTRECLHECVLGMQDKTKKQNYLDAADYLEAEENIYLQAAQSGNFNSIQKTEGLINNTLTNDDMIELYEKKFSKKHSKAYKIYDEIKSLPEFGRCPLCGHGTVTTLDHYLPKTSYGVYSITPVNLIPACFDCNKNKREIVFNQAGRTTLHPYFDNFDNIKWLCADIQETVPCALNFKVSPDANLDETAVERINFHLKTFNLNKLYSSHAAVEIENIKYHLDLLFEKGGKDAVQEYLKDHFISCRNNYLNSWQTATYEALSNSEWFCSGGFQGLIKN